MFSMMKLFRSSKVSYANAIPASVKPGSNQGLLVSAFIEMMKLKTTEEVYAFASQKIFELIDHKGIVTIADIKKSDGSWQLKSLEGVTEVYQELGSILGFDPMELRGEKGLPVILSLSHGKLTPLGNDLHTITQGTIGRKTSLILKKFFSIDNLYSLTFAKNQEFIGNVTIIAKKACPPINVELVEAFVYQLSLFIERNESMLSLAESEEKLKLLQETAGVGVGYYDSKGCILFFNKMAADNMRGKPEDFTGKTLYDLFPKEIADAYEERMRYTRETLEPKTYEDFVDLASGRKYFLSTYSAVPGAKKDEVGIQIISNDITRQKEEEIRHSTFFNLPLHLLLLSDLDGKILKVNPGWTEKLGYTEEELIGKPFSLLIHPEDLLPTTIEMEKLSRGETVYAFENRYKHKNGEYHNLVWSAKTISHQKLIYAIAHDITEKKQAELSLRTSEARLALAIRSGGIGTWVLNLKTNELNWDSHMLRLYGMESKDFHADYESWRNAVHHDDLPETEKELTRVIEEQCDFDAEFRIIRADKSIRHIRSFATFEKDENGVAVNMIGVNYDITNQKTYEKELAIAREKAEESNRLKSSFLANMSHEIRTPMNSILGFSRLLDQIIPEENQKGHKFLQHIHTSGERLLQLINDIIDIAKIESNQLAINKKECKPFELLKDAVSEFKQSHLLLDKPNLNLVLDISNTPDTNRIFADPIRIKQVIDNLISNALKYSNQGSIHCGMKETNGFLEFYIADEGIGIPKASQPSIFERFHRIDSTDFVEGSGLGLSICKGLVELMGGEIRFESDDGKGSCFYFTIPVQAVPGDAKATISTATSLSALNLKDKRIFIAEDDVPSFIYLKEILHDSGALIEHFENGERLLQRLNDLLPDLILLDINMPIMNGYQVLDELKKKGIRTPVIAQTAFAMPDERLACFAKGCREYISKPIHKERLFQLISTSLSE